MKRVVTIAIAMLMILSACGGGDGGGSLAADAARVCDGGSNSFSPDFETVGQHTLTVLWNAGDDWTFAPSRGDFPDEQLALTPGDGSVVACLTITSSTVVNECDFEEEGDRFVLELADATYDVELRAQSTGEIVGSTTGAEGTARECPLIGTWDPGEGSRFEPGLPVTEVQALFAAVG